MSENIVVFPEHLASLCAICKRFKKARQSVKKWHEEGAPIGFDGYKYCAEYNQLQNWLVERDKKITFDNKT